MEVSNMSLNRYIAMSGLCSRRKADDLIKNGDVTLNGNIAKTTDKVNEGDRVEVEGKEINLESENEYYILNKPVGYLSSVTDDRGRKTVVELIPSKNRLYPVGRLDFDSSGLIILTNDGDLAYKLTHPKHHVSKTYIVTLDKKVSENDLQKLRKGILLDGIQTQETLVNAIDDNQVEITLFEGRNRQIRRMCEALGKNVLKLHRIKIGNLSIGDLKVGEFKRVEITDIL